MRPEGAISGDLNLESVARRGLPVARRGLPWPPVAFLFWLPYFGLLLLAFPIFGCAVLPLISMCCLSLPLVVFCCSLLPPVASFGLSFLLARRCLPWPLVVFHCLLLPFLFGFPCWFHFVASFFSLTCSVELCCLPLPPAVSC